MKIRHLCTSDPILYQPQNLKRSSTLIPKAEKVCRNSLLDTKLWRKHFSQKSDDIVKQILYSSKLNSEAIDMINCEALDNEQYVRRIDIFLGHFV